MIQGESPMKPIDQLTSGHPEMEGRQLVPIANLVEIKASEKFYRLWHLSNDLVGMKD